MNILEQLTEIMRDIFDDEELIISNDTCSADIEDWDSLAQIQILDAIEKYYHIVFSISDITSLGQDGTVGSTVAIIEYKTAKHTVQI